jgi:tetratricopeptide (TPR) repeat protein
VATRKIKVSVVNGSLDHAEHPVAVGHYDGDIITGAEQYLNQCLSGRLKVRMQLGLYPGPLETAEVFFNLERTGRPGGAIVLGLGPMGELSPASLAKTFTHAALIYALAVMEDLNPPPQAEPGGPRSASITTLLIGSGSSGVEIRESVRAILQGVRRASVLLKEKGYDPQVAFDEVEFLELWEDLAIQAARALHDLHADPELHGHFDLGPMHIKRAPGGRTRVTFEEDRHGWQRLKIVGESDGSLRYSVLSDRARTEVSVHATQRALVDQMITRAIYNTGADSGVAKTLYELLIPDPLKGHAVRRHNLVLVLNEDAARYPWELLEDRSSDAEGPLALEVGVVRQLETNVFRERAVSTSRKTALVIGDPKSSYPPLPEAQEEAQKVTGTLRSHKYDVSIRIGASALEIIEALYDQPYRVLHLAGHGVYQKKFPGKDASVTGMVIGDEIFLTPAEIEQMRRVPELVFLNCCHLGRTEAQAGEYHRLAANLAAQFIRIGVRAVVAAGWMVEDQAAQTFATQFYNAILSGIPFGHAVLTARRLTHENHPGFNTWGAYQCYGDPDYTPAKSSHQVEPAHRSVGVQESLCLHAPSEAIAELGYLAMDAETATSKQAGVLRNRLEQLVAHLPPEWLRAADINAALGRAYGELGLFSRAIACYRAALEAETSDFHLHCLERLADLQSRCAVQSVKDHRASGEGDGGSDDGSDARRMIDQAIDLVQKLCALGKNGSRLALLGACHRRKALLTAGNERRKAVKAMGDFYRQAFEHRKQAGVTDPDFLLNRTMADLVLRKHLPDPDKEFECELADRYEEIHTTAFDRAIRQPGLWTTYVECTLLRHVSQASLPPYVEGLVLEFKAAQARGAAPRDLRAAIEHIEFLVEMFRGDAGNGAGEPEPCPALRTIQDGVTALIP